MLNKLFGKNWQKYFKRELVEKKTCNSQPLPESLDASKMQWSGLYFLFMETGLLVTVVDCFFIIHPMPQNGHHDMVAYLASCDFLFVL